MNNKMIPLLEDHGRVQVFGTQPMDYPARVIPIVPLETKVTDVGNIAICFQNNK